MKNIRYITIMIASLMIGVGIGNFNNFSVNAQSSDELIGRVSVDKTTGKMIEYQSGLVSLGSLKNNAISSGYSSNNVEEKYITETEYKIYMNEVLISNAVLQPKVVQSVPISASEEALRIVALEAEISVLKEQNRLLEIRLSALENKDNGILGVFGI